MSMADLPPLTALRTFWYVAERQSFKAAAEDLHVTQTAVSHQIRQLEAALGVRLFERGKHALRLTREGQRLLPYVQQGFSALRAGVTLVKDDADPHELGLSVDPGFAQGWLIARLARFQQLYPELRVTLRTEQTPETFSDGRMDLSIRFAQHKTPGLRSEEILRDYLLVVATPDFVTRWQPALEHVLDSPRIATSSDTLPNWSHWFSRHGYSIEAGAEAVMLDDPTWVVAAALSGQGLALVPQSLVQDYLDDGRLVTVFEDPMELEGAYYVVAPEAHFVRPKVRHFMQWLREELRESYGPDLGAYHGT